MSYPHMLPDTTETFKILMLPSTEMIIANDSFSKSNIAEHQNTSIKTMLVKMCDHVDKAKFHWKQYKLFVDYDKKYYSTA